MSSHNSNGKRLRDATDTLAAPATELSDSEATDIEEESQDVPIEERPRLSRPCSSATPRCAALFRPCFLSRRGAPQVAIQHLLLPQPQRSLLSQGCSLWGLTSLSSPHIIIHGVTIN